MRGRHTRKWLNRSHPIQPFQVFRLDPNDRLLFQVPTGWTTEQLDIARDAIKEAWGKSHALIATNDIQVTVIKDYA